MIRISQKIIKKQPKFWNHALFHPTDAIEDPWGRRILDRVSADGAIKTIRIYSMFEDIVYFDENDKLCFDFRLSDLRLDYLIERGFDLLIAYGGIPNGVASSSNLTASVSKNKTRYKGKLWNTAPPKDYAQWEEICYAYTRHLVDRYGEEVVSGWYCQCFNEPDGSFWMIDTPKDHVDARCAEYCKLYEAFVRGVRRATKGIRVGGPALAQRTAFLDRFLEHVKRSGVELDYLALHTYGTGPDKLNSGERPLATENHFTYSINPYLEVMRKYGFEDTELLLDEWGAASHGFYNVEECPSFLFRENEIYSAYFTKLIYQLIESGINISKLMICLSGQHEMVTDFSGFRNFFTLNFITKPIYNAHLMTSKLGDYLMGVAHEKEDLFVVPTKNDAGNYAVMLSYCAKHFDEDLPTLETAISFDEDITGKTVTVYCIDREHTNPYRAWERAGKPEMTEAFLEQLREEGKLKPMDTLIADGKPIPLSLTANATLLITVE